MVKETTEGLGGVTVDVALKAFLGFVLFSLGTVGVFVGVLIYLTNTDNYIPAAIIATISLIIAGIGFVKFHREHFNWKKKIRR